jgi:uncharacterized protein YndB with AHSA1/START domain
MFAIHRDVFIALPVDEVFAYLADFEHDREWRSEVIRVERMSGAHPGTRERYLEVMHFPGMSIRAEFEVTEYDPPRVLEAEGRSESMKASQRYELAPADGGTRLCVTTHIETHGLLAMGQGIALRLLNARAAENGRRLKRVLESGEGRLHTRRE